MKKHSFSLASTKPSSSSKPNLPKPSLGFTQEDNHRDDDRHEFLTEFVPSDPKPSINQTLQIPRMENTWNWKPKMRNLDLPTHHNNGDLKFEAEAPSAVADSDPNMSYGLNLRNGDDGDGDGGTNRNRKALKGETFKNTESLLLQKFKEDLNNLPEEQSEDYNDVPVEGFGAALLRAYGWCEEKDKKEGVKVVRIVKKRGDREGLGFDTVRERGVNVGKVMRVVGGRHLGLKGKVVGKLSGEEELRSGGLRVVMKLLSSGEEVTVGGDEVAELWSLEEEMCLKKLEELRNGGSLERRRGDGIRVIRAGMTGRGGRI
ncbi:hypothetical protein Sjap_005825 [Stephania japonica]|uniref:Spp2/MOS2 G-patch domain-containing protein n=1 Tax=Stephania japonica TaxID=461633 RepID=A0AAP0K782_9MAGN